jgi:hypothetical protein
MIDIEILKKQNSLVIDDDGMIMVKPINENDFETFPLKDLAGCLRLTMEEYLGLRAGYYRFNENLNGLEINDNEPLKTTNSKTLTDAIE